MKRPGLLAGIVVGLTILIGLLFIYPHEMIAPGKLIPAHAQLQNNCFACHAPLRGASSARCITCHQPAVIGIRTTKGSPLRQATRKMAFHAQLTEANCLACHSDHASNLATPRRPKRFDHILLKPAIAQSCSTCHAKPAGALHAAIVGGCASCHRTSGWRPASFEHNRYFRLDAAHNATCATCHPRNNFSTYTCYSCHAHQPDQIAAKHREEGIVNFQNCTRCHRSAQVEGEGGGGGGGEGGRGESDD